MRRQYMTEFCQRLKSPQLSLDQYLSNWTNIPGKVGFNSPNVCHTWRHGGIIGPSFGSEPRFWWRRRAPPPAPQSRSLPPPRQEFGTITGAGHLLPEQIVQREDIVRLTDRP